MTDTINHPAHYTAGGVECIDAIKAAVTGLTGIEAVYTANVIKYMWRWHRKGGAEDLEKAMRYLRWLIEEWRSREQQSNDVPSYHQRRLLSPMDGPGYYIRGLASRPGGYVLAVDFDGTLCEQAYPDIGKANETMIGRVKFLKDMGITVVLWTCREGKKLDEALAWCSTHGLWFDAVNDNPESRKALYGNNPRKIGYDELWDDRAVAMMDV